MVYYSCVILQVTISRSQSKTGCDVGTDPGWNASPLQRFSRLSFISVMSKSADLKFSTTLKFSTNLKLNDNLKLNTFNFFKTFFFLIYLVQEWKSSVWKMQKP